MGVHDYSCFLHSRPRDQNLIRYEDDDEENEEEIIEHIEYLIKNNEDQNIVEHLKLLHQDPYKYIVPLDLIDSFGFEDTMGESEAYLFIYDEKSGRLLEVSYDRYNWDDWDFENHPGYWDILWGHDDLADASVWKRGDTIIKNVCSMCYTNFFKEVDIEFIPSTFFRDVSNTLNIPLLTYEKETEYYRLKEAVYNALSSANVVSLP